MYKEILAFENKQDGLNPLMTNGLFHCYHLGESTVIIRDIRSDFEFYQFFNEISLKQTE